MSLLSRAGTAEAETRAVFPAFGCPSGGLWYNSELEQPADTPHLLRCLRCAALNGRSASLCWRCEAELPAGLPLGKPLGTGTGTGSDTTPDLAAPRSNHPPTLFDTLAGNAEWPTMPDTTHEPAPADAAFSVSPSAVAVNERLAAFSQHKRRAPRRLLGAAAIAAFAAIAGAGAYLIQRPPPFIALEATDPARRPVVAAIAEPRAGAEPAAARLADPSRTEPPSDAGRPEAKPVASPDPPDPATQAAAPPTATPPAPAATLTAARGSTARGTRNTRHATTAPVSMPLRGEPAADAVPVRPPTPVRPGACTATVAALGLCQAASAQPKE